MRHKIPFDQIAQALGCAVFLASLAARAVGQPPQILAVVGGALLLGGVVWEAKRTGNWRTVLILFGAMAVITLLGVVQGKL